MVRLVISNFFALAKTVATEKTTFVAVASVPVMYLGWVYSLPATDRKAAGPGAAFDSLSHLIESTWIILSGWLFGLLVLLVSSVIFWLQHRRIRTQGQENARLRKLVDPHVFSAGDRKNLDLYAQKIITESSEEKS